MLIPLSIGLSNSSRSMSKINRQWITISKRKMRIKTSKRMVSLRLKAADSKSRKMTSQLSRK
jgi:hypothetical protein